jgi:hypothetical protein
VNDTAVAARLMRSDYGFLLEHGDSRILVHLTDSARDGETDDPRAHDAYAHAP